MCVIRNGLVRQQRRSRWPAMIWRQPRSSGCDWSCCARRSKRPNRGTEVATALSRSDRWLIRQYAISRETCLGPAGLERDIHQRLRPLVAEHPSAIHSCVSFVVDAGAPHRPIAGGNRARHEQVPPRSRLIAFHLDVAVQAVMDREGENPGRTPEKAPDRLTTFEPTQTGAFPYRILGEQHGDPVGVVLLVAQ